MVRRIPATKMVPLLDLPVVLAATANATVPFPLPLAPDETVIQPTLLTAVQPHPVGAVTAMPPVPPLAVNSLRGADTEYEQPPAAPDCVTEKLRPAIVIVPLRGVVRGFTATV